MFRYMQGQEIWQMKTSRRGDSWGDVGVLGVCGVMVCSKYVGARDLACQKGNKGAS